MRRCIETHRVASFGTIPAGSIWADDSPHISEDNADKFADVDEAPQPEPVKPPVRKFGAKKVDD